MYIRQIYTTQFYPVASTHPEGKLSLLAIGQHYTPSKSITSLVFLAELGMFQYHDNKLYNYNT